MRQSRWTPSIVPADELTVYLVADDFGRAGSAWRETDMETADLETVSKTSSPASMDVRSGLLPLTRPSAGQKTFPRTLLARSSIGAIYSSPTFLRISKNSSIATLPRTPGSTVCAWSRSWRFVSIDVFVDELDLAELGFGGIDPEATGRPSYHPSLLLKLYIYGY